MILITGDRRASERDGGRLDIRSPSTQIELLRHLS